VVLCGKQEPAPKVLLSLLDVGGLTWSLTLFSSWIRAEGGSLASLVALPFLPFVPVLAYGGASATARGVAILTVLIFWEWPAGRLAPR